MILGANLPPEGGQFSAELKHTWLIMFPKPVVEKHNLQAWNQQSQALVIKQSI